MSCNWLGFLQFHKIFSGSVWLCFIMEHSMHVKQAMNLFQYWKKTYLALLRNVAGVETEKFPISFSRLVRVRLSFQNLHIDTTISLLNVCMYMIALLQVQVVILWKRWCNIDLNFFLLKCGSYLIWNWKKFPKMPIFFLNIVLLKLHTSWWSRKLYNFVYSWTMRLIESCVVGCRRFVVISGQRDML